MRRLSIGGFTVEPDLGWISGPERVRVEPKTMQVLLCLAAHPGDMLSKERIVRAVWHDVSVTDDALVRAVGALRRAFGDSPKAPKVIETIPTKGYRLIAAVSRESGFESLAVLPLENLSGDPEQEYVADGMTEALITELAQLSTLRVISRTSVMRFKATRWSLSEIARELGVDLLVEGAVMSADGRVRISAQLIEAAFDRHLWANTYEHPLQEILTLQRRVSRDISDDIRRRLRPERPSTPTPPRYPDRTVDPAAYEAYLKGMFHLRKLTPEGFERGLTNLQEAADRDPTDPMPYAGLALGYATIGHSPSSPSQAFHRAKAAATRALELDESLAEAHLALGNVQLYFEWDWPSAERCLVRALALNPSLAAAHFSFSWYHLLFGRTDRAVDHLARARKLDPLEPLYSAWLAGLHGISGRVDTAFQELDRALELDPDFPPALYVQGWFLADRGACDEAIAVHQKLAKVSPEWRWALARTYAVAGETSAARRITRQLKDESASPPSWGLAVIHAHLGEKDEAFRWLDAAYRQRHSDLPWAAVIPEFEPLHDDPRLQELQRRLKLVT